MTETKKAPPRGNMRITRREKSTSPAPPGTGPLVAELEEPKAVGILLSPLADAETLIRKFKEYVSLKDKLLEPTDYMWHVKWQLDPRSKQERKVFKHEKEARKAIADLKKKRVEVELEKRIIKSGCLKLSKAFGLSTTILDFYESRDEGVAIFKIRAVAPNGQYRERVGSCDRKEKGKGEMPFDNISATANTRAEDRAIMALVGGETTSEEFEEHEQVEREEKRDAVSEPAGEKTGSDGGTSRETGSDPDPNAFSKGCAICGKGCSSDKDELCLSCQKLTPEEQGNLKKLNEKFVKGKPAAPHDKRTELNRRLWALATKLFGKEEVEKKLREVVKSFCKKDSLKDLEVEEYRALVECAAKALNDKVGKEKKA